MKPEDQLMDSLLKKQSEGDDEQLLQNIEDAIDSAAQKSKKPRNIGLISSAAAVVIVGLTALGMTMVQIREQSAEIPVIVTMNSGSSDSNDEMQSMYSDVPKSIQPAPSTEYKEQIIQAVEGAQLRQIMLMPPSPPMDNSIEILEFADAEAEHSVILTQPDDAFIRSEKSQDSRRIVNQERYGQLVDQAWKSPFAAPLSTFSVDVDTASYTNIRRTIRDGHRVQPDAVRIEEMINYFSYRYQQPKGEDPFAFNTILAECPWNKDHLLARIAIQGKEIENQKRPASNLVFLVDVSGSMNDSRKLPLLQRAMNMLLDQLDERDKVAIVVYAGNDAVVLDSTVLTREGREKAKAAIGELQSAGSTNGGAGIKRAYQLAAEGLIKGGVNRVILATDGDFNVGLTGKESLVSLVKQEAKKGINLSVLGMGTGNLNDAMLEAISNDGNGNYFYIDTDAEAERVFLKNLTGTLVTIAKDVKIQVEFNPARVQAYRLIGYANRQLKDEDFNNDKVDAGDIGAGHTVTAFYEITPVGKPMPNDSGVDTLKYQKTKETPKRDVVESNDWFTLKLRYKRPDGDVSKLLSQSVASDPLSFEQAGKDFQFASAVALTGMKLRDVSGIKQVSWQNVQELIQPTLSQDPEEERAEFLQLVKKLAD